MTYNDEWFSYMNEHPAADQFATPHKKCQTNKQQANTTVVSWLSGNTSANNYPEVQQVEIVFLGINQSRRTFLHGQNTYPLHYLHNIPRGLTRALP